MKLWDLNVRAANIKCQQTLSHLSLGKTDEILKYYAKMTNIMIMLKKSNKMKAVLWWSDRILPKSYKKLPGNT